MGDMTPPEEIAASALRFEDLGYSHIMVPEDSFYIPAQVGVTLALSATRSIPVGTSIVSALTRNPAVLAMEVAGLSRAFPDRYEPGIGLGMLDWLRQMGIKPAHPLVALRERLVCLRRLLTGEAVSFTGETITLDSVGLAHAATNVPITLGVMGPRMLQLAGELADVTLFPATAGVEYFRYAMHEVGKGMARVGREASEMRYSTIALACVDDDGERARNRARPVLASFLAEFASMNTFRVYGISDQLTAMLERGGEEALAQEMPDQWIEDLALVGTPQEVVNTVRRWVDAGVDSIAIFFPDDSEEATLRRVGEAVIPGLLQPSGALS